MEIYTTFWELTRELLSVNRHFLEATYIKLYIFATMVFYLHNIRLHDGCLKAIQTYVRILRDKNFSLYKN